jgi:predicted membrane-bound spermidine synthase
MNGNPTAESSASEEANLLGPAGGGIVLPSGKSIRQDRVVVIVVHLVFVVSGVSALLYQLVWQRSLLLLYGSNTESVAMVVSAFLVGLGLGSIAGGALSKVERAPLVLLFSGIELGIGLYGIFSLQLFHLVGEYTLNAGTFETGLLAFGLVLVPTLLMGATLPLLVAYRVNTSGHVGRSVSWLYFVNTLGGALGAFAAAVVFFSAFGLSGTVRLAAALNVVSALSILSLCLLRRKQP